MGLAVFLLGLLSAPSLAKQVKPAELVIECYVSPCELQADFDGDGKSDSALLVRNKRGERGIRFQFANQKVVVLGAGRDFGNGGKDFAWMDSWKIVNSSKTGPAALLVEKQESASALIAWKKNKFHWSQQGD